MAMKPGTKWKNMSEEEFKSLKALMDQGTRETAIRKLTGRGVGTLWLIRHSNSFAEYVVNRRDYNKKNHAPAPKPSLKIKGTHHPVTEEKFKLIHQLHKIGATNQLIGEVIGNHSSTVSRILGFDTWEKYEEYKLDLAIKNEAKRKAEQTPVVPEPAKPSWNPFAKQNKPTSDVPPLPQEFVSDTELLAIDLTDELASVVKDFREAYEKLEATLSKFGY